MLQPLDGVGHQQRDDGEEEKGERVLLPILPLSWIDAAESVQQPLDRAEKAGQGLPVSLENPEHVEADGLG
jgi:hypothetical protein